MACLSHKERGSREGRGKKKKAQPLKLFLKGDQQGERQSDVHSELPRSEPAKAGSRASLWELYAIPAERDALHVEMGSVIRFNSAGDAQSPS